MCKSENKICKGCTRRIVKWNTCEDFDAYKDRTLNMDANPTEYKWMKEHGIDHSDLMTHEFIIVSCTSCKNEHKGMTDKKYIISAIAEAAAGYAGNFVIKVQGSKSTPTMFVKKYCANVDDAATDTETESEIDTAISNNQLVLRAPANDDDDGDTEEDSDTEKE